MSLDDLKARHADDAIRAHWWIDIAGLRVRYGLGSPPWSPSDTSTGRVIKDYLSSMVEFGAQTAEPLNGKTKGHTFTFSVLDADDEITALMSVHDSDVANTYLTSACTLSATTLHVTATSAFTAPCDLYVGAETMRATSATTTTFAVTRGMYSSTTVSHALTDGAGLPQTVTVWAAPRYMLGRQVRLHEGRIGMDEEDAASLAGVITGADEGDGVWTFRAAGTLARLSKMINVEPATAYCESFQSTPNPMIIRGGVGDFYPATLGSVHPWVQVDDAIMAYSSVSTATILAGGAGVNGRYRVMRMVLPYPEINRMRLVPSTTDEQVDVTQLISHAMFVDGSATYHDPISVILCLLLSRTGDKTNHATYDVLPEGLGLALPASLVDVSGMEALRDSTYLAGAQLRFIIEPNTDAKKWIEEQILRPCLLFFTETWEGKISLSRLVTRNEAAALGAAFEITEDDLLDVPEMQVSMAPIGEIKWKLNHNPVQDEFMGELTVVFQESIDRYGGSARKFELEAKCVHDPRIGLGGKVWRASSYSSMPDIIGRYIATVWDRFAVNPLPVLTCEIPYGRLAHCVPGAIVRVTCTVTPNLQEATRGLSGEYFQIVEAKPQPDKSSIELKLWQIGVHDTNSARLAPSAMIQSIVGDYAGLGRARVWVYPSVCGQLTGKRDHQHFTVGDMVRCLTTAGATTDSVSYAIHATGTSATYDWIDLDTTDVDNPPVPEDGAWLDTTSYTSATAGQRDRWCFNSDANGKLGGTDKGNQRT